MQTVPRTFHVDLLPAPLEGASRFRARYAMTPWLLDHLRCPFCTASLSVSTTLERRLEELLYGVLTCDQCAENFAVVEGIPLLAAQRSRIEITEETTDQATLRGALLADVITCIRAGDAIGAFALLLNPTSLTAPSWTFKPLRAQRRRYFKQPVISDGCSYSTAPPAPPPDHSFLQRLKVPYRRARAAWRRSRLSVWREELARFLRKNADWLTATELLRLFYGEYSGASSMSDYFVFRFGQPRHLAALSALSILRSESGVVLDLACGAGHLTHYLTYGLPSVRAVGVDRSFFRLYVAKHRMAPAAEFVCMPADLSLPFETGFFSSIVCSDAFHYFRHKSIASREITRVMAPDGAVILARVGNSLVAPNEGYELTPKGYRELFPTLLTTLRGEEQLMSDYLNRRSPDLSLMGEASISGREKWLTLFASRKKAFFAPYGSFVDMPHAVGRLVVNPIFRQRQMKPDGAVDLEFAFPSEWYAFEDAAYSTYAPDRALLTADLIRSLREGRRTPAIEEHLSRFELIGTPDRFERDVLPWVG